MTQAANEPPHGAPDRDLEPDAPAAEAAPPSSGLPVRLPNLHRPYLVVLALFGVGCGLLPWLDGGEIENAVFALLFMLTVAMNAAWLYCLVRDADRTLGAWSRPGVALVLVVLVVLFWLGPVVTAIVLALLLRNAEKAAREVDPVESGEIGRLAGESRGLVVASAVAAVVLFVAVDTVVVYSSLYGKESVGHTSLSRVMGARSALLIGMIGVVMVAYHLFVAARAVPALYRCLRLLRTHRWVPPAQRAP